jgi:hypothetical protein
MPYVSAPSVGKAISAMLLALMRLRVARRALWRSSQGHLVLADRWPTDQANKMDGPRLTVNPMANWLIYACARIENWAYARMPRADVCFILELSLENALKRNQSRIKKEKENDEEIMNRFIQNRQYSPLSIKTVRFMNDGDFYVMRNLLLNLMWSELIRH